MSYAVAFISDRGHLYLPKCIASLYCNEVPSAFRIVDDHEHRLGMAGAVRTAWNWAVELEADYLLHVEEDFLFRAPVDVTRMRAILEEYPWLAQVVLKRQPWNEIERAAGGIIEANPCAYTQRDGFVEHELIFSLNPCLIPRRVLQMGWPDGNEAEFTAMCLDQGYTFAFLGEKFDPPLVEHIGVHRGAGWKL